MNAAAYLTSQGWRGSGHALHPNGKGISKPLLVSKKTNVLGVGKKAHDAYADQWWSRAIDDTLRSLNGQSITGKVATSNDGDAKSPAIGPTRWTANGGLYGSFVRGEGLRGTRSAEQDVMETPSDVEPPNKKRRLDDSRERLAERDRSSTKNHPKKRTSNKPSSNIGSKNGHASAAAIEASTEVSPLRSRLSSRDKHQQEVMKNSKAHLVESKIGLNSLTDSTTCSEVAGSVGHSKATPILETADDKETAGQGKPQGHRSKRKELSLKEQGLIRDGASNGRTDHRVKKKKRKRRKDEGP
ncbi:MAG: hypothetical protein Q9199_005213 [Rusavskia elegans]